MLIFYDSIDSNVLIAIDLGPFDETSINAVKPQHAEERYLRRVYAHC